MLPIVFGPFGRLPIGPRDFLLPDFDFDEQPATNATVAKIQSRRCSAGRRMVTLPMRLDADGWEDRSGNRPPPKSAARARGSFGVAA